MFPAALLGRVTLAANKTMLVDVVDDAPEAG